METAYLEEYVALAHRKSFTEAARELHITQSTLSKHIAALEREYGVDLFVRDRTGVSLTEAGAVLYRQALQLIATLKETRRDVARAGSGAAAGMDVSLAHGRASADIRLKCAHLARTHGLTAQETNALVLYLEERGFSAIQDELGLTRDEVAELLASVYRKLGVRGKQDALDRAHSVSE